MGEMLIKSLNIRDFFNNNKSVGHYVFGNVELDTLVIYFYYFV